MNYNLLLYVGSDFLIPAIVSEKNDVYRYNGSDSRLWLYFREDPNTTEVLYGYDNYRFAKMRKESYFGDYWKNVGDKVRVSVHGVETEYVALPQISGMLRNLSEWYKEIASDTKIRTVCIFDEHIGHPARKAFLGMLGANKFSILSYSVAFNTLLASYDNVTMDYGRQIIVVEASGRNITVSSMIHWNGRFVGCNEPLRIDWDGENPVKMALVKHVVDTNNREHNYLTPSQVEAEYIYQMQYVDGWMRQAETVPDDESFLVTYHLSIDDSCKYSINIKKSFLLRKQEDNVRQIIDAIEKYCSPIHESNIARYIFTGDIFATDSLWKLVSRRAPGKSIYIGSSKYTDVISLYGSQFGLLSEAVKDYDKIISVKEAERASATVWFREAESVLGILEEFKTEKPQFAERVKKFAEAVKLAHGDIKLALESSDFDKAQTYLNEVKNYIANIHEHIVRVVENLLTRHGSNRNLYDKIIGFGYASDIIRKIDEEAREIKESCTLFGQLGLELEECQEKINFYRSNYDRYKEIRRRFDEATSLIEKQKLLKEMRPLTGEVLPDDTTDTAAVKGDISMNISYKKSLFGLKKQVDSVEITVKIGDAPLPYHCVLVVSDAPVSVIERTKPCFSISRGTCGVITQKVDVSSVFGKPENLFARIFVDKDKELMADIGKISFNTCCVTLK